MDEILEEAERHRLARRLDRAVADLEDPQPPLVVVDLDVFDANLSDLVRRAAGKPVRSATKSLRVPGLAARALADPGFRGVLAYQLREALWLADQGLSDDVVMATPPSTASPWADWRATRRPASTSP